MTEAVFNFKAINRKLTQEDLKKVLSYDPSTGDFVWLVSRRRARVGNLAGRVQPNGYRRISINGREYLAHRLAWLDMTGGWPAKEIDHKDGDRANNRWENLREATGSQNRSNTGVRRRSRSGLKGVRLHGKRYRAEIRYQGKTVSLGSYDTPEEAHAVYVVAAHEQYGEFARAA